MVKKIYFTSLAAAIILLIACGSSKEASKSDVSKATGATESYTTNKLTPVIDGQVAEWPEKAFTYDNAAKIKYAVANDATNIYIAVVNMDRMQQMKMIYGGTEIWIDSKMKKNKTIGIKYPIGGEEMKMPDRSGGQPTQEQMKAEAKSKMRIMEVSGFKTEFNGSQSVFSPSQIKPVIDWDSKGEVIYELAIPFSAMNTTDSASMQNISVGIVINGLKRPSGMPGGGGMPGGMRPPAGMTPPGGGSMPDMRQIENLTKDNSIWTKYTISK